MSELNNTSVELSMIETTTETKTTQLDSPGGPEAVPTESKPKLDDSLELKPRQSTAAEVLRVGSVIKADELEAEEEGCCRTCIKTKIFRAAVICFLYCTISCVFFRFVFAEHFFDSVRNDTITEYSDAMYFMVVTLSSVGNDCSAVSLMHLNNLIIFFSYDLNNLIICFSYN